MNTKCPDSDSIILWDVNTFWVWELRLTSPCLWDNFLICYLHCLLLSPVSFLSLSDFFFFFLTLRKTFMVQNFPEVAHIWTAEFQLGNLEWATRSTPCWHILLPISLLSSLPCDWRDFWQWCQCLSFLGCLIIFKVSTSLPQWSSALHVIGAQDIFVKPSHLSQFL